MGQEPKQSAPPPGATVAGDPHATVVPVKPRAPQDSQRRALATIRVCNRAMLRATEESELLRRITDLIVHEGGYCLAWVGMPQEDTSRTVKPIVASGEHCDYLAKARFSWGDDQWGRGPVGTALRTGKAAVVRNIATDPGFAPWRQEAQRCGFVSVLSLPLPDQDSRIGVLSIYSQKADVFDRDEVILLEELANDLAFGIVLLRTRCQRQRAEKKVEQFNTILLTMRHIGQIISGQAGRQKLLDSVCQGIVGTGIFQTSWIGLIEQGRFRVAANAGLDANADLLDECIKEHHLLPCSQYVLTHTSPFVSGTDEDICGQCPLDGLAGADRLCVRLEYGGMTYGTWTISGKDEFLRDPQEQFLFKELAKDIAMAMHNADLTEQRLAAQEEVRLLNTRLQQHVTQLAALHSIDLAISASMDLGVVVRIILDEVTSQLGIDAVNVLAYNSKLGVLESIASRGFHDDSILLAKVRLGEGNAGRVALGRRKITIANLLQAKGGSTYASLGSGDRFVSYCGLPLIAKGQIRGVLEAYQRKAMNFQHEWLGFLEAVAGQLAIAVDVAGMFDDLQRTNFELVVAYDATIEGWSREMDLRDASTQGHCQRVADLTVDLAARLQVPEGDLVHFRRGALLHDIGKMAIPDSILLKAGALTDDEWGIMKKHPVYAYETLLPITFLRPALDIPYCHHEKWDGTGYPRGLKEDLIPRAARIFAVVDIWDALRSDRPYRPAWPKEKCMEHLRSLSGTHLDGQIVEAFLEMIGAEA